MTTSTYTASVRRPGDPGYDEITEPTWVLEDATGEWVADLALGDTNMFAVEIAVAEALECSEGCVTATPQGGNITGEASHRNLYVTADEWAVVVTDA